MKYNVILHVKMGSIFEMKKLMIGHKGTGYETTSKATRAGERH